MKLSDEDIAEFIKIWKEEFGEDITPDEARIEAYSFMRLCMLLVSPLPDEPDYQGPPLINHW
jgi:hypothetical protein